MLDQAQMLRNYINGRRREDKQDESGQKKGAKIISVTSGKGGVGKTNFTVNFAIELAKRGNKVLIIDADFGLSNIDVIMGIIPKYDLSYVLRREKHLAEIMNEGPFGVKFISGGSGVYDLLSLDREDIEYFLNELLYLDNIVDTIIFDTGAGINENNIQLIRSSNEVILVTTTEPTAIVDAYALAKTVFRNDTGAKIRLVINKADSAGEARRITDNFSSVTNSYLNAGIEELGYILEDANVSRAVKMQKPFVMSFPNTTASKNMANITTRFLNLSTENDRFGLKSFFQKMLKR
ncbi:MAG: MinD/ParA family protein [Clostridia bacterium]|nr:MinD/ParA family protein [Clostridia bacterium]